MKGLHPKNPRASEDDVEVLSKDVTLSREWVTKVNAGVDAVEIFGQCLGKVEDTPSVLEGHTLDNIESIRNDLDGRTQSEMSQTIATLKCKLMDQCHEGKDGGT
uniref:Uncharacterized protein n=1 Tax=Solanum tuberosum TaxID=4113 RepID=M0ZNY9_SOLTU